MDVSLIRVPALPCCEGWMGFHALAVVGIGLPWQGGMNRGHELIFVESTDLP